MSGTQPNPSQTPAQPAAQPGVQPPWGAPGGRPAPADYRLPPGYDPYPPPSWPSPDQPLPDQAPAPSALPRSAVEFHQMFRNDRSPWWKGLIAIGGFVVGYLMITTVLTIIGVTIDAATGRFDPAAAQAGRITLTPVILLVTNLGNIAAVPLALLLQWLVYGQPVRWSHSVVGFIRWRLMLRVAVVVAPVWFLLLVVPALVTPGKGPFTAESFALLVIVLLTTPLQAAGEEYGARGLIARAAGTWAADPRLSLLISTVVSAAIFCLAHGAGDPWLILYYFCFGVAMSLLVWRTGGLEASCVVHAVNNVMAFGSAIVIGQGLTIDRSAGAGGPGIMLLVLLLAGVVALVWWRARKEGVQRTFVPAR